MAVTADQVVVELQAKVDGYMRDTGRAQADFSQKVAKMGADAVAAGKAFSGAFDGASGAFVKAGKGAEQAGKGLKVASTEGRMAQQQMRNLAFQFQDIGTMLASGQSPFMLLAQQLPQVTMYGGQLNGVMGALKGTVAGLLSPLGLLTTGFVLAASAAIKWTSDSGSEVKTLDEVLKRHKALIDEITGAYGEAALAASDYAGKTAQELGVRLAASIEENKIRLQAALQDVFSGGGLGQMSVGLNAEGVNTGFFRASKEFEAFSDALRDVYESIRRGEPELALFHERVLEIGQDSGNAGAAAKILDLFDSIFTLDDAVRVGGEGISEYAVALRDLDAEISKVTSEKAQKEVSDLAQKAIDGEITIEDFKKAIAGLSSSAPDLSSHISEFLRLIGVIRQAKAEAEGFSGRESQGGRTRYGTTGFMQLPGTVSITPTARVDPYFDDPNTKKRGGSKRENEYARLTKQIEARTKALQAETAAQAGLNPLIDDYGYAAEKAKLEAQLLVAAEQAKIEITPSVEQAIKATAEGYAQATVAARKLAEEQREALRSAEEWLGVGRDVTQGFISDLLNGASAADALSNALKRVGDALINDILNNIFKINSAGSGGILSSILGFFGGGFRANTTAGAFFGAGTGIPQFAGGTNYAPGGLAIVGESGPELVNLPRGSQVIPNHRLNAGGGQSVVVNFNPVIDARGADPAAIQRLETGLAKVRAEIPAQVVESVRKAQKSNVKLG